MADNSLRRIAHRLLTILLIPTRAFLLSYLPGNTTAPPQQLKELTRLDMTEFSDAVQGKKAFADGTEALICKKWAQAVECLEKARQLAKTISPVIENNLAVGCFGIKQIERAREHIARAKAATQNKQASFQPEVIQTIQKNHVILFDGSKQSA